MRVVVGRWKCSSGWVTGQPGDKPDEVASVVEPLVVDGLPSCGVGGALDPEDWTAACYLKSLCHVGFGGNGFKLVFSFNQGDVVFALQQRKDGFDFQVVGDDLLADIEGKIGFVERHGHAIGQTHTLNPDHEGACREGKMPGDNIRSRYCLLIDHSSGGGSSCRLHIFDEAA